MNLLSKLQQSQLCTGTQDARSDNLVGFNTRISHLAEQFQSFFMGAIMSTTGNSRGPRDHIPVQYSVKHLKCVT
ncbi:unnamed protein product [Coffea canephora]|uniref:Uncharacterized protein n=1 Tax=Coffea canephora TaxID=49390 RepID=A0A068TR55_COFCA|nr:unnamed protein product [Coffea canephora]